jgi:hypothetical protein
MYKIRAKITNFTSTFIYFVFTQLTTLQCLQLYFILCSHISLPHISDKYSFVYYVRKMNYHYSLDNNSFVFHVHTFHYHHRLNTDFLAYYVHIFQYRHTVNNDSFVYHEGKFLPPHKTQLYFCLPCSRF